MERSSRTTSGRRRSGAREASDYDQISRGIADSIEHCVLRLNPQPGERILDLSTGTGWTSRVVARRGATVIGVDIAGDLLDAARANAEAEGLPIEYQLGDAESLPFEDGAFDAVVSTCGVMFASRPEAAAAELARVCPPGRPDRAHHLAVGQQPVQDVRGDEALHAAAAEPGAALAVRMGPHRAHPRAARRARSSSDSRRACPTTASRAARRRGTRSRRATVPTRSLAASLDPERRAALRDDFIAFHDGFPTELGICVPREYWLTVGVRT